MSIFYTLNQIFNPPTLLFMIFFFILGACIGSFLNVVIFRYNSIIEHTNAKEIFEWFKEKNIPFPEQLTKFLKEFNLSFPSSHCPICNNKLKWYHNVPILGYIILRGKCAFCKSPISIQYPIVEIIGGIILLSTYIIFIPKGVIVFIIMTILFFVLFTLLAIDIKSFLLPDGLNYFLIWFGLFLSSISLSIMNLSLKESLYGVFAGYIMLYIIAIFGKIVFKKESIGQGDFKLLAGLGSFIGVKGVIFTVFSSPFIGIFTWLILKTIRKDENMLPYGPSLIICSLIYIFYGEPVLKYLNIMI